MYVFTAMLYITIIFSFGISTVACRAITRSTTAREANIQGPFLGNGSVNTFPKQRVDANNRGTVRSGVFYSVRKEDNWGDQASSVVESVTEGFERVKLKNLYC
jgi:hypothetical protein